MDTYVNQGQHRLSRTYLKHWAYWHNGKQSVCVYHNEQKVVKDEPIDEFTVVNNEFDIPLVEGKDIRHYEKMANIVETRYNHILETISNKLQLDSRHEDILRHFTSLTL